MAVPLRDTLDDRPQTTAAGLHEAARFLESLPDPDSVGAETVIEIWSVDGWAIGYAFVDDGNVWAFTQFDGTRGDVSSQ
jgi:hypothetical protein